MEALKQDASGRKKRISDRSSASRELIACRSELRRIAAELVSFEERQRRTIATELHDGISQSLAIARMQLTSLMDDLSEPAYRTRIEEVRTVVDEMIEEVRGIIYNLSPPVLFGLGLYHALLNLVEEFQHRYPVSIAFRWDGEKSCLHDDLQMFLYRSLRELLTNVVKHAHTAHAHVSVICRQGDGTFFMRVEDDGREPPDEDWKKKRRFGLASIEDRAHALGGRMQAQVCRSGSGFSVTLEVPTCFGDKIENP